jgi:hypothetical protein
MRVNLFSRDSIVNAAPEQDQPVVTGRESFTPLPQDHGIDNSQFGMSNPLSFNADIEAPPAKRRRWGEFELQDKPVPDFVTRGLITVEQAQSYFDSFVPFLPLSGLFA